MTKVTVLHNVSLDAGFGLNQVFGPDAKSYEPRSHELVKVFEFDTAELLTSGSENIMPTNGEIVADIIFRAFNVGDDLAFTAEVSRGIFQHTWVYDKPAYLHADDRTPICAGRADAIVRKPELLARYYPGGTEAHPELVMIMAGRPDLAALVEAS